MKLYMKYGDKVTCNKCKETTKILTVDSKTCVVKPNDDCTIATSASACNTCSGEKIIDKNGRCVVKIALCNKHYKDGVKETECEDCADFYGFY